MGPVEMPGWSQLSRTVERHCSSLQSFELEGADGDDDDDDDGDDNEGADGDMYYEWMDDI